jgi:hypothetical protein
MIRLFVTIMGYLFVAPRTKQAGETEVVLTIPPQFLRFVRFVLGTGPA